MKTHHILIGNCEELLSDFIETLFQEVCDGQSIVLCTRTARVGELIREGCSKKFDLVILVPHNLVPEESAPTPMGLLGEAIRAVRTIKSQNPAAVITIVAPEARARYEPLLLEAGADCVLELPFDGEELRSAVGRLLRLPARLEHHGSKRWHFAGVLLRGLRLLTQA